MAEPELVNMDEEMDTQSDSFSNSAEGSSDEEDADEERLEEIQKQLDTSPYTYELHIQLIALCRKLGDLDKLRAAREKMNEIFPLTPELWLDWLTDEKPLATTPEQKEKLVELFERSVKDYASVSVWLEYVQFSIGNIGEIWEASGIEKVRQTFERAITAVGIHATQGCLIWEAYREFETIYLLSLKSKSGAEEEVKEQEERIFNIFKRQLSIPLLDMDKTYAEFKEYCSDSEKSDISSVDYAYKKALKMLNKLQEYEEKLFGSEGPHYEEYKEYIEFEKQQGDPSRVQSIFERAVVENCLKDDLWLDYAKYLDKVVKIPDMSLLVYERAVRNCPWSLQLWIKYGRALERYEQPHEKIIGIFENALTMGFSKEEEFREIWLGYLDYLRRVTKIKVDSVETVDLKEVIDVFDRAVTQMEQYFWGSESQYVIVKYWIFFNAKYKKDILTARQLWKDLIACNHKEEARVWLDYANFEKVFGDVQHYRKALLNALSYVNDWPETFVDLLLTFEREEGTLESFEKSEEKCESEMKIINKKRLKKMEEAYKKEDKRGSRSSKRQPSQLKSSRQESRQLGSDIPVQMDAEGFKIPPLPDKILHMNETKVDNHSSSESENRKRTNEEADKPEPKKKKVETNENHGVTVEHDPTKDDRTVFLSNLSYHVDEEQIKEFSSKIGEVEDIRLVKDYKGRSKGFCYVVYKSELDAKKALEKDRERIEGRPVLISPCEDRKNRSSSSRSKIKFTVGLEKNKVFVKGLPFSVTDEELGDLFKEHGSLKSARVVTYRNGNSKGYAYVEYKDEASAANAVLKMDGAVIQDKTIFVAISNPPPRKVRNEFVSEASLNYFGTSSSSKGESSQNSSTDSSSSKSTSDSSSSKSSSDSPNSKNGSDSPSSKSSSSSRSSPSRRSGVGGSPYGPRGRGRTQLSMLPRALVRPATAKKDVPNSSTPLQNGQKSDTEDSNAEKKSLSNSDFANMLKK